MECTSEWLNDLIETRKDELKREKIITELDELDNFLQKIKKTPDPPDESCCESEFCRWVIYLTERQKIEEISFSRAQVYEQAFYEVYYRSEFGLPESGEIKENSSEYKKSSYFSATDFLFQDGRKKANLKRAYDSDESTDCCDESSDDLSDISQDENRNLVKFLNDQLDRYLTEVFCEIQIPRFFI